MNEKIREPFYSLMYKASEGWNQHLWDVPPELLEAYSKLIIQECIKSVEELYVVTKDIRNSKDYGYAQWWEGYEDRGSDSTDAIKKHFGVK
jgi:hypothetical protein